MGKVSTRQLQRINLKGGEDMVGFDSFEIKGDRAVFYNEEGQTLWFDLASSGNIKFRHWVGRRVHGR